MCERLPLKKGNCCKSSECKKLRFSNAAHNPPLLWRSSEQKIIKLDTEGLVLGLQRDAKYNCGEIKLNKNDLLTLGWYELSTKHYNTVIKKKQIGRSSEYSYDYDDPETYVLCSEYYNDSSGNRTRRFIPCEDYEYKIESNGFIVASTKKTLYRDSKIITPLFMLFKFERL